MLRRIGSNSVDYASAAASADAAFTPVFGKWGVAAARFGMQDDRGSIRPVVLCLSLS